MLDRRSVPRYAASLPGQLRDPATGKVCGVTVVTLSIRGCALESSEAPGVGGICELHIEGYDPDLRVAAMVVWRRSAGDAGLRFLHTDPLALRTLRKICGALTLQPISWPPPLRRLNGTGEKPAV